MLDPRWMGPPEIVAAIFEAGPGPASTLANQLVWVTETINHELAMGLSAVNTTATATQWVGLGGTVSAVTATGLNTGLQTLVGWITHKVAVTQAAVEAYAVAASTVIPALVCQANRDEAATLNATNFLGFNTPAIIALDTAYFGEHYPHNSGVGATYSGALGALAAGLTVPPPITPLGASPAAPVAAGEAAAQSAAGAAANGAVSGPGAAAGTVGPSAGAAGAPADLGGLVSQGPQLISAATAPMQQAAQLPAQLAQQVAEPAQSLLGSFGAVGGGMFPATAVSTPEPAAAAMAGPWRAGGGIGAAPGPVGGYPIGLTRYTQPTSSFHAENAGRPTGLRAGMLETSGLATQPRAPGMAPVTGAAMPLTGAAMANRGQGDSGGEDVTHARIVVDRDARDR